MAQAAAADMYQALAAPETGGEADPYIRTRVRPKGGSTAFGPVQITGTLLRDALRRGAITDPSTRGFAEQTMLPMYDNFAKYGAEPNKPGYRKEYDYGGSGNLDPALHANYEELATALIADQMTQSGGNIDKFIQRWRGTNDPGYAKKVKSKLLTKNLIKG